MKSKNNVISKFAKRDLDSSKRLPYFLSFNLKYPPIPIIAALSVVYSIGGINKFPSFLFFAFFNSLQISELAATPPPITILFNQKSLNTIFILFMIV